MWRALLAPESSSAKKGCFDFGPKPGTGSPHLCVGVDSRYQLRPRSRPQRGEEHGGSETPSPLTCHFWAIKRAMTNGAASQDRWIL
jgi:hypothetical protein